MSIGTVNSSKEFFKEVAKDFYKDICRPKETALYALGGFLLGKSLGVISGKHGAIFAATNILAYRAAEKINNLIYSKIQGLLMSHCNTFVGAEVLDKTSLKKSNPCRYFESCVLPLKTAANFYFSYVSGSLVLSLLERQITVRTALVMPLASGVTGFVASALIYCINDRFLGFSSWIEINL